MTRATNSALMRLKNEKHILSLINKGPISRVEIAKKTGLTKAAVTIIVDELKQKNIVFEQPIQLNTVGRNPVMLYLNGDAFYFISINITRRSISVGITNLAGKIISQDKFSICAPDVAFDKIKALVECQIEKTHIDRGKIYKASVVTPGPVDTERGMILNPPNFNEWHYVSVVTEMQKSMDFEFVMENVSSATALAEKYFGVAGNDASFMILQVDEGIGSGIIINDMLFKRLCEFGHISIKHDGIKCECGNCGCLEKYASIPNILQNTGYESWQQVIEENNMDLVEAEAEYLSTAIISANNIFEFDKIVLCGDLTYQPELLLDLISLKIKANMLSKKTLKICAGEVTSKLLIASAVAIHDLLT